MGCTASKLDNEDTVRRCKDRLRFMKEVIYARHHLAAAHSDYCRSLRITGSALVSFAAGEPLAVSHHTPAILLRDPSLPTTSTSKPVVPPQHQVPSPSPSPSVHAPHPPPPPKSTASSHYHQPPAPPMRRKRPIKLPHILSDSSFSSSPLPQTNFTYNAREDSTYATTPSQASSLWNWDHFYPPPSPPDSEYFHRLHKKRTTTQIEDDRSDDDRSCSGSDIDDKAASFTGYRYQKSSGIKENKHLNGRGSNYSSYSSYSTNSSAVNQSRQGPPPVSRKGHLEKDQDEETDREEVQCSKWDDHDHYSSTSYSSDEDVDEDLKSRSDFDTRSHVGSVKSGVSAANLGNANVRVKNKFSSKLENVSSNDDGKSAVSWRNDKSHGGNPDGRIVVRHKDLVEIVTAIKEYFDKAASSGDQVSELLETGRAQLNRSFKQLKKTVYHSSGMLSNLSSSWTSKPPLAVKYHLEPNSIEQSTGLKSFGSILERLLAWEKKLYIEVKAREGVKIEHDKKLSVLQNQEYRGEEEAKLDKTKTSINKLQSLIVVASQAVATTSSIVITLRDSDLVPLLVELCHGFMYMWRSMNQHHEIQNNIVQQVRGLVLTKGESTSDLHRQATRDLESAVSAWHSSFCRLIKFQRDFLRSLHAWIKLTTFPVSSEQSNISKELELPEVSAFFDEWKLALDRIPDMVASEAIKSFVNLVHSVSLKQTDELKIKKRTETASKELEKKASSLRKIERKFYHSYSMVGIGLPDAGRDSAHVLDARDPLADKKTELAACQGRVEDEMLKHSKAVEVTRAMTVNNIQTGLPGVFQAVTSFSRLSTETLEAVCTRSYAIK